MCLHNVLWDFPHSHLKKVINSNLKEYSLQLQSCFDPTPQMNLQQMNFDEQWAVGHTFECWNPLQIITFKLFQGRKQFLKNATKPSEPKELSNKQQNNYSSSFLNR